MRITDRAVFYARKILLQEMEVEYEEVNDLQTLLGSMVTAAGKTQMIVDGKLPPIERIRIAFHMLAHRELGHIDLELGARLEFVPEDRACLAPEFVTQEREADELAQSWLAGKNLPFGLRALTSSERSASILQRLLLRVLFAVRALGHACRRLGVIRHSQLTRISAERIASIIDGQKEEVCFRHMESVGRRIYSSGYEMERQRQDAELPDSDERVEHASRIESLARSDEGGTSETLS